MKSIYLPFHGAAAEQVAIRDDGKVVLSGIYDDPDVAEFAAVRLDADGSLDPAFSGDGIAVVPYDVGYGGGSCSLLQQGNGKLLLSGTANVQEPFGIDANRRAGERPGQSGGEGRWITILRLRTDGTPDPAFGDAGNGPQTCTPPPGVTAWRHAVLAGFQNNLPLMATACDSGAQRIDVIRLQNSDDNRIGTGKAAAR